jgi:hypothetical protein
MIVTLLFLAGAVRGTISQSLASENWLRHSTTTSNLI